MVQEALLVAMVRAAARCQSIPESVTIVVSDLGKASRKHIRNVSFDATEWNSTRNSLPGTDASIVIAL